MNGRRGVVTDFHWMAAEPERSRYAVKLDAIEGEESSTKIKILFRSCVAEDTNEAEPRESDLAVAADASPSAEKATAADDDSGSARTAASTAASSLSNTGRAQAASAAMTVEL